MRRKSLAVALLLALGLAWTLFFQWQALSVGKAQASTLSRAVVSTGFQQGQRLTVQLRTSSYSTTIQGTSIFGDGGCPNGGTSQSPNTATVTAPFAFECKEEKLSGQAVVNFPAGPFAGTLDGNGDLVLDAPVKFTGKVDITGEISRNIGDNRRFLDLTSFYCPSVRDTKQISLASTVWSASYDCSVNKLNRLSNGTYGLSGLQIKYFGGRLVLESSVGAEYATATSCPALGLQNGLASPAQSCPPAKLLVETQPAVLAGNVSFVVVTARKADGTFDPSYNGPVQVSLAPGTTPKLACLRPNRPEAPCAATQTMMLASGNLTEALFLRTPEQELTGNTVLRANDPPLSGNVVVKAEAGSVSAMSQTRVKSPLDLKINRIEVQQGYLPTSQADLNGPWLQYRDLLIRVFLDANRTEFKDYASIHDISASLTVRDQTGAQIEGSPFQLKLSAFAKGTDSPNQPYIFQPNSPLDAQGSESLNHVLYVRQEQLNLSVKLDDVYPDKDPTNNEKTLPPLRFVTSKPLVVLYSPAQLKTATQSSGCPIELSITNEVNLVQLAYPVSLPESQGRLRFIQAPNPNKNESCEVLTDDPLPLRPISSWWFWLNRTKRSDVRAWVYFVDKNFFPATNRPNHAGISSALGGSVSIISDKCLGPDTGTQCGILAHELGHLLNLGDTYQSTGVTPVRSPNNPPQGEAAGNPVGIGSYNWFQHRFTISSKDFVEYMGASNNPWTDRTNWNYLRTELLPAANAIEPAAPDTLADAAAADNFVIVQGQIRKNGAAEFTTCYTLTDAGLADAVSNGAYSIETLDANAAVLNSLSFTPNFRPTDSDVDLDAAHFSFALPFSSAVRQLRLRSAAGILATRQVSATAPVVNFTTDFGGQTLTGSKTVRWSGSDADGNALRYSLFYSPDGQLQIPLALETTDTSYEWDTAEVPSGSAPRLTLTATDGVNATTIESRPFTLPNHAPKVVILTPTDQQQFKTGETVNLSASLYDVEEGLTFRPALTWSSNLQGTLGTGKQLALNNLQVGTHRITASGADSQGARGSATITVIVRADNFSNLEATPGSADFGTLTVGQTRDFRLSVQNTGNAPLTINAVASNNPQFRVLSSTAPFTIAARSQQEISLRFTPVAAGDQSGTLTITGNASNRSSLSIALTGKVTGATARTVTTVSAASFSGQTLSAESIVAAFGTNLAIGVVVADTLPLPTSLAGTTVRVRDSVGTERLAPLFFVAPQQINYLIPIGTAVGAATIIVTSGDSALSIGTVTIANTAPGLFTANATGQGVPAAVALRVKANGVQSYEPVARFDQAQNRFVSVPIELGPPGEQVFLLLFGTGLRYRSSLTAVTCQLGGVASEVLFVGEVSGLAGLDQVNLSVPRALTGRGEVDLVLTVDGSTANTVRVAFAGTQTCNYALSSSSQSIVSSGGTGSVNVTAQSGCAWTATSNADFIAITSGASGVGNGTVNFTVAANPTNQRTGTLTIAGQTFTVTQTGRPCSYSIPITSQSFNTNANTGSINVTATSGCAWTATSNASFITVTSGASGNGNGTVNYSVTANSTTSERTGTMTIAGITFTVTQAAAAALTVSERRLTGGPIPAQCLPPPTKPSFAPTDGQAYLWTLVANAKIGDLAHWEFVQPGGTIYATSDYTVAFNDSVCFWGGINIAGTRAASLPGAWQVRLFYNGALLVTENFIITAGAAGFSATQQKPLPAAFSGSGQARPH